MKKKLIVVGAIILSVIALMYAEYRYIMCAQRPYYGEDGTLYIEMFGQIDEYYAAPIEEME